MSAVVLLPRRRGPAPTPDSRRNFRLFPVGAEQGGSALDGKVWLYALGFTDGIVKVGMTAQPRSRMTSLWRKSPADVQWVHLFGRVDRQRHGEQCAAERAALASLEQVAERLGNSEYFRGLSKADCLRVVRAAAWPELADDRVAA